MPTAYLPATAVKVDRHINNLQDRARMLRTVPHVGLDDVTGPALAWLVNREVFAVTVTPTALLMPSYQFADGGTPLPVMKEVITALERGFGTPRVTPDGRLKDDWDLAGWMYAPNPLLGNRRPYRLLVVSPARVLGAAAATNPAHPS